MRNLLELKNIRVNYGKGEVLKGISLEVQEKSIVTLIGANGAGKTTTLRSISGLLNLKAGEIWFKGQRIDQISREKRVELGIAHVPEGRRLFPYMSVVDNLYTGAYTRKDTKNLRHNLEVIFSYFPRLSERSKQKAGSLSGGEQQMLAIGRALMAQPGLMLCDEPTMGLSPLLVRWVEKIIRHINNKEGVAVLLVEQNARVALALAEIGYVLETGTITIKDESRNLINNEEVKKAYLGK